MLRANVPLTRFLVNGTMASCRTSRSSRARRQPPPRWIRSGPGCSARWPSRPPPPGWFVREVGPLARRAGASGKRLPTLTIDTQIGFRSAADRAAFADDLTAAVLDLAARYHHDDGRPHRLVVAPPPPPEGSA